MKVVTVVGARPQFIKAAPVSRSFRAAGHSEILIHTGQHYDHAMSEIFFEELGIATPDVNLGVGSGSHGAQTARMLEAIEEALLRERPDRVIVYGDTNSTLAGALAACKLQVPVAHVEAGLRSFNRSMPEEHNRVLTDHCSDVLFCPTQTAVDLLRREGITNGVHLVGDTMYDAVLQFSERAAERSNILERLNLPPKKYLLATLHRPYNTDDPSKLISIVGALEDLQEPVVFPVHPRTRARLEAEGMGAREYRNLRMIDPVGYLDMLNLERNARLILTDSGGMQKEAFFFAVPCITLRPETEWAETVASGWNVLAGTDAAAIHNAVRSVQPPGGSPPALFGDGHAAEKIVEVLAS